MAPFISILLPAKNPGCFLKERLASIFAQTVTDWELIIVDSSSTDGSREVFEDLVRKDPRVSLYERPEGLYQAWNFGIQQAKGKYVYVATADDTMVPSALEKMSGALEAHPECGLCDTLLSLVDAEGNSIREFDEAFLAHYWHLAYPRDRVHVRRHPSDFYAHLGGKTVYTSITQVMIRRSLFEKTGLFPENYGSSADYMWGMRAALYSDVIFLPEYLSSWRIHAKQATFASDTDKSSRNFFLMAQMAEDVFREIPPEMAEKGRKMHLLAVFKGRLLPAKRERCSLFEELRLLAGAFFAQPMMTLEFLFTLSFYFLRVPGKFVFIYTYDRMIRRRAVKFYRGRIEFCDAAGSRR